MEDTKIVEVCEACNRASCWYGEFGCDEFHTASTIKKTVGELRKLKLENEQYWSDEKMEEIYGDPDPFNFKVKQ